MSKKEKKETKKSSKKVERKEPKQEKKESLLKSVKKEMSKVHFPNRKDMIKYSTATIFFVIFFSVYFLAIEAIMAFVTKLIK